MYSVTYPGKSRFTTLLYLICFVILFSARQLLAEGSKELSANGGGRVYMLASTLANPPSFPFPTNGTMKVYAKAGETIYVGSSAQGIGLGSIVLYAPNATKFTSGTSTTIGLIANRAQEAAGPLPNVGGYTAYTHTVTAAEEGIWQIDFISQNAGQPNAENSVPLPIAATAAWTQSTGQYIAAFDVSVRNTSNSAFLTGRLYTNIFSGILGDYLTGFNGIFQVLTKDGFQYSVDNNGQAGYGFSFFVNNKGFRKADATASFQSVNSVNSPNIQDPRVADTPTDITYKMFFNNPASDMPATANIPVIDGSGGVITATTWLLSPITTPTLTNFNLIGTEGTPNKTGTAPLGGTFTFNASKAGTYVLAIDVDKNGVYTDPIDRKINATLAAAANTVVWDGLDGLGNKVPAGNYTTSLNVVMFGGEVHFPFFDVERNVNGIKLTRNNGPLSPDFTVYWDDSQIVTIGTPSNPLTNLTGISSQINGHKWGTAGPGETEFGDTRGMDTWSYIAATPLVANINFAVQEADLEVLPITNSSTGVTCAGQQVTYTVAVKNNGPNDVAGSKFAFSYAGSGITGITVTDAATTGASSISGGTVDAVNSVYTATVNLANGAVHSFNITGTLATTSGGGTAIVTASILRAADVTDPDATDPNSSPPTNALSECNAAPSGTGCNNIQTNTITFLALPNAGADQTVNIDDIVTLTDASPGTWSQIGTTPLVAAIAAPSALSTTITGLSDPGKYQFLRTNALGCTDTVVVTVVPKTLDLPSVFTPNGDGKNDTFTIPNIQSFPGSQLYIYNRLGNEVFRSTDYQNTWTGAGLSEGTYYYLLKKKEVSGSYTSYKGWLFLKR